MRKPPDLFKGVGEATHTFDVEVQSATPTVHYSHQSP